MGVVVKWLNGIVSFFQGSGLRAVNEELKIKACSSWKNWPARLGGEADYHCEVTCKEGL